MVLLAFALLCWVLAMVAALFGFALVTGGAAVIAQSIFWLFFLLFGTAFVVGYTYKDMSKGNSQS